MIKQEPYFSEAKLIALLNHSIAHMTRISYDSESICQLIKFEKFPASFPICGRGGYKNQTKNVWSRQAVVNWISNYLMDVFEEYNIKQS